MRFVLPDITLQKNTRKSCVRNDLQRQSRCPDVLDGFRITRIVLPSEVVDGALHASAAAIEDVSVNHGRSHVGVAQDVAV